MLQKLKVILLFSIFALSVSASGQTAFGLKGGLNLATLKVDDPEATYNSRTGFHGGIFFRSRFSKIAIQPEVLLWTQGSKVTTLAGEYEDSFAYVAVPVLLKFYIVHGLNVHAGPQFGFLIDVDRDGGSRLLGSIAKEDYKPTDISVSAGAGYDLPFGLSLDVRYNIGVQDINNVADGEEAKSRVFMVSLGYNFLR